MYSYWKWILFCLLIEIPQFQMRRTCSYHRGQDPLGPIITTGHFGLKSWAYFPRLSTVPGVGSVCVHLYWQPICLYYKLPTCSYLLEMRPPHGWRENQKQKNIELVAGYLAPDKGKPSIFPLKEFSPLTIHEMSIYSAEYETMIQ